MFTGIIEEVGSVLNITRKGNFAVLKVKCSKVLKDTIIGDSIAVNGVCLTVTSMDASSFEADISYETIKKSSFADITQGSKVNLERALTLSTRLGGHMVSGHVDGVGKIEKLEQKDNAYILTIRYPQELDKYLAEKGSVTIDGISLTTARCSNGTFDIAVIPHTFSETSLSGKRHGAFVNIEVDVVARYLEKLLQSSEKRDNLMDNLSSLMHQEDF
jgi:riboflavin synthase